MWRRLLLVDRNEGYQGRSLPLIAIASMQAVRSISAKKIQAAQALGASSIGVTMLVGAELTSDGIAWIALIVAEYLSTDIVLVGVLIMAALGYGLVRMVRAIECRLVHWIATD